MSNKLLAKIADQVMAAFPSAFDTSDCKIVGNPVRTKLVLDETTSDHEGCNILVVGGSLGAKVFNDLLRKCLKRLLNTASYPSNRKRVFIRGVTKLSSC